MYVHDINVGAETLSQFYTWFSRCVWVQPPGLVALGSTRSDLARPSSPCAPSAGPPDSGKQKKVSVQWFVRACEIPAARLELLGRQPHPQEVFYYQGHNCDDEVDVSSILRPVQVRTAAIPPA